MPEDTQAGVSAEELSTLGGGSVDTIDRAAARLEYAQRGERQAICAVGRYEVHEQLGEGAFGEVHAARDPGLDRRVALKVFHPEHSGDMARARLLREAQALGALEHPHVVSVFDIGEAQDDHGEVRLYIAMELVEGTTLDAWLKATSERRPMSELLPIFAQISEGLQAVHDAGLVHRDLKPGNILIGNDGRARVADFGLARAGFEVGDTSEATRSGSVSLDHDRSGPSATDLLDVERAALTATGAVVGTPAYMAPEQFAGETCSERSDQFALCVVLYEALYGQRPFPGKNLRSLRANVLRGRARPRPRRSKVPLRLHRTLLRGLSVDPALRFDSVRELVAAARVALQPRRWPFVAASVAAVAALAAASWLVAPPKRGCARPKSALAQVWDKSRRQSIRAAIEATDLSFAPSTAGRVETRLDAYAAAWVGTYAQVCEGDELDPAHRDGAMACLAAARRELDAVATVLVDADTRLVPRAVLAVGGLPAPQDCLHAPFDGAALADDSPHGAELEALRDQLSRAAALHAAGRYDAATEVAKAVIEAAEQLGDQALLSRAYDKLGNVRSAASDFPGAEAALSKAYFAAQAIGDDRRAAAAAVHLVGIIGAALNRPDEGAGWVRHANNHLAKVDNPGLLPANLEMFRGRMHFQAGDYDAALASTLRAADMREQLEPDDPRQGLDRMAVALIKLTKGNVHEARAELERAVAMVERDLGSDHPKLALALLNLGHATYQLGELDAATSTYERALEIWERAFGPSYPLVADCHNAIANIEAALGRPEEAIGRYRLALSVYAEHPHLKEEAAMTRGNLGLALAKVDRYDEGALELAKALEQTQELLGPEHRQAGDTHNQLATVLIRAGRHAEGLEHATAAVKILESAVGADHPATGSAVNDVGDALVGLGRPAEAIEPLERALVVLAARGRPRSAASARFALARALVAADRRRNHGRALELVEAADRQARALGREGAALAAAIAKWRDARAF